MFSQEELENRFTYHAPTEGQPEKYQMIREGAKTLAHMIVAMCPPSRETALSITNLEEVVFWANAAIARRK